jgi:hypothetical protein
MKCSEVNIQPAKECSSKYTPPKYSVDQHYNVYQDGQLYGKVIRAERTDNGTSMTVEVFGDIERVVTLYVSGLVKQI